MSAHEVGIIVAMASLITAIVALSTVYYLRKQFVILEESHISSQHAYEDSRKSFEVDTLFRIKDEFRKEKFIEFSDRVCYLDKPLFKTNGGTIDHTVIYNALSMINEIAMFIKIGIISEKLVLNSVGGEISNIYRHKEIKQFIQYDQDRLNSSAWKGVVDLAQKWDSKIKKLGGKLNSKS